MILGAVIAMLLLLGALSYVSQSLILGALVAIVSLLLAVFLVSDLLFIRAQLERVFYSIDKTQQRELSRRSPFFSSSFAMLSLIDVLCHRMGALISKLESLTERLRRTQSEKFAFEVAHVREVLSGEDPRRHFLTFSKQLLETAVLEFRARGMALVVEMKALGEFPEEGAQPHIFVSSIGSAGRRFDRALHSYVREFFESGKSENLGFKDLYTNRTILDDFAVFGFRYINAVPLYFSVQGRAFRGIVWFGYDPDRAPSDQELKFAEELVPRLSKEFRTYFEIQKLEGKVQQAAKSQMAKNEMIAHLSHDIRSPLNNIRSILQLIRLEGLQADSGEMLGVAMKNCDSLKEMVEDLLDYSRHTLGGLKTQKSRFCVGELTEGVVNSFLVSARLKGLSLSYKQELSRIMVDADRKHIKRILNNLIGNALKYTERGGVQVSLQTDADNVVTIAVSDTGRGLSDEQVKKLFIPFNRFDDGAHEGIGLGLALSKILVGLNEGKLEVKSDLGKGSDFQLKIPLAHEGEIQILTEQKRVVNE